MKKIRVGVAGTGFIARRLFDSVRLLPDMTVTRALTHRSLDEVRDFPGDIKLTRSIDELIEHADVVVECSGNAIQAAEVVRGVLDVEIPVVTMNSEFHVTCGSFFVGRGYLTEAYGDQPGVQAALRREIVGMGFKPLVYGNMKGFLNLNPSHEEMLKWSERQGFRVCQTTSFTDGTKVQIEQVLVANAFRAKIAQRGLLAPSAPSFDEAVQSLAEAAISRGQTIADFCVVAGQAPGVFIVAAIDECHHSVMEALKMGSGPYYTFMRPFHLCALEIPNSIRDAFNRLPILLDNSTVPEIGVAAVAKTALRPGQKIPAGIGSFEVRGEAIQISEHLDYVPIGLLYDAVITRHVKAGDMLSISDVDLPVSFARDITLGKDPRTRGQ